MEHRHCAIEVIHHTKVEEYAKKHCTKSWRFAFVEYPDGKIILSEVMALDGRGGYCPASICIADREVFNRVVKEDPDFYGGKTWEEYRSWVLKDLIFPINMEC